MVKPVDDLAKEPLMESPSGYGYQGVVLYDDVADKVQCHECGEWFRSVSSHISFHGLRSREYKEKYELNFGTPLNIPSISTATSIRHEFLWRLNNENITKEEIHEQAVKRGFKGGAAMKKIRERERKENGRKMHNTVEMMNKYGTCPRQIEEKFTAAVDHFGGAPTFDQLREYDHALLAVLYRRFKSYSNALQYFGLSTKRRVTMSEYPRETILALLKKFVDDNLRLPNPVDTKMGLLPDYMTIAKHFKDGWMGSKRYAFEYLKETYPEKALVYDSKLRRINIMPPGMTKRKLRPFPISTEPSFMEDL